MNAITYDTYGPYDALTLKDIPTPAIKDNEVLVRVHAAALHIGDCFAVKGEPFAMRIATGLLKPKYGVPGFDVAGRIEAVGSAVKRFQPGDEVFGASTGTCAEYASARAARVALKPANLTLEEAAAIPTSGLAALHGLRDTGKLKQGQHVLINGASGGVGSFAVQIAKSYGAEVTGVCGTGNVDMVRSLGADHVIDYTLDDFTKGPERYNLIFDNIENRSLSDVRRVLKPNATIILNSGREAGGIRGFIKLATPLALSPFSRQDLRRFLSTPNRKDLIILRVLAESGKLRPVIDKTYPLAETAAALVHIEAGHVPGKVVITVHH